MYTQWWQPDRASFSLTCSQQLDGLHPISKSTTFRGGGSRICRRRSSKNSYSQQKSCANKRWVIQRRPTLSHKSAPKSRHQAQYQEVIRNAGWFCRALDRYTMLLYQTTIKTWQLLSNPLKRREPVCLWFVRKAEENSESRRETPRGSLRMQMPKFVIYPPTLTSQFPPSHYLRLSAEGLIERFVSILGTPTLVGSGIDLVSLNRRVREGVSSPAPYANAAPTPFMCPPRCLDIGRRASLLRTPNADLAASL